jgi:hypothetical protein
LIRKRILPKKLFRLDALRIVVALRPLCANSGHSITARELNPPQRSEFRQFPPGRKRSRPLETSAGR